MRAEDIRDLLKRQPFIPFRIYLTDGKTYDITHPELVFLVKHYFEVAVGFDPLSGIPEKVDRCSMLHIVRTEDLKRESTQTNN
jgi:hypothetical protein